MKKLPLLIVLVLFLGNLQAQITAAFTSMPFSNCIGAGSTPVVVNFLDQSTSPGGLITNWEWDFDDGIISNIASPTHTYSLAGNYTVCLTVTNTANESDTECKTNYVSISDIPVCTILPPDNLTCDNAIVTIDGGLSTIGANIVYEWRDANFNFLGTAPTLDVSEAGNYTLNVSEIVNGCSAETTVEVIENTTPPIANAGPDLVLNCATVSIILDGAGSSTGPNITYEWFDPNNNPIPINPTTASLAGVYTLVVTNTNNGCSATDQMTISEDINVPTIDISTSTLVCQNDLVTLDVVSSCVNCSIEVINAMGNIVCLGGFPCEVNPADGPFEVVVTDTNNGCFSIESVNLLIPNPIVISNSNIMDVSCAGENDGAIEIDISGGSAPYIINWSNGSTAEDQFNLAAGIYTLSIVDANGCELVENFEIFEPTPISITIPVLTNASCTSLNDGAINITVSGGTASYTFNWSNGMITNNPTGLSPGLYQVTITDGNSCTFVSPEYEILQGTCFNFASDTTICVGGTADLSYEITTAGWTYAWSPTTGLNNPNIPNPIASPTETTTYFLTITDGSGMVIFNEEGPTVTVQNYLDFGLLDFSNSPICEGDSLKFYGNLGTSFLWTGPNGYLSTEMDPILDVTNASQSGTYNLVITDFWGCTASADVEVFIDNDCVWPGDTDTNKVVNHFDLLNIGLAYDSVGTTRENASFDWFGQPSLDWSQTTPNSNVNYKHIDADGNGIIDAADTMAITQNFGLTHNFSDPTIENQFTDLPSTDGFTIVTPFYVEPDTLIEGETMALDIVLGDVSNVVMGLYGVGFSLEYDSSVVVPGSASINFDNCWLGDVNADAISVQFDFSSPGRIDAAITRIDGMEMDGYGLFGELIITLEDDILLWDGNGSNNFGGSTTTDVTADFAITNYHLINFSQEEILVEGMATTSPVGGTTSLSFVELNELIDVFPNPADDVFFVASQKIDIERVRIFSATGELKSVKTKTGNNLKFSTEGLASGIYFIEIQTREGIVTKKLLRSR